MTRKVAFGAGLGSCFGLAIAGAAFIAHPYSTPFFELLALALSGGIALAALALRSSRRTRSLFAPLLVAAICVPVLTYASMATASATGNWRLPSIHVGPDVPANVVVLLREDASDEQIFAFTEMVLGPPHPVRGSMLPEHVRSLLAIRVGKHGGFALQLDDRATNNDTQSLRHELARHPLVWRVYENVAPSKIHL